MTLGTVDQSRGDLPPTVEVSCSRQGPDIACAAPRGIWDAELRVPGAAPVYFWKQDTRDLETTEPLPVALVPGASLCGRLDGPSDALEALGLSLVGASHGRKEPLLRPLSRAETKTKPDSSGFFQLAGLGEGVYELMGELEGEVFQLVSQIELEEGKETRLDPLAVAFPEPLEVTVQPAADPDDTPWKIVLKRRLPASNVYDVEASGNVDPTGYFRSKPQAPGRYVLSVQSSTGDPWHMEEIDHSDLGSFTEIRLSQVAVVGTVVAGDEPVVGSLHFGGRHGEEKVTLESDEEGRFSGVLPRRGKWHLDVSTPSIFRLGAEPIHIAEEEESPVELTIELANTRIHGRVYHRDRPVKDAVVRIEGEPEDRARRSVLISDEDGRFELWGLEPGQIKISASRDGSLSPWTHLHVAEDSGSSELRLELAETRRVTGKVVCGDRPDPGASVLLLLGTSPGARQEVEAEVGAEGSFEADVPEDTQTADLFVTSPRCATHLGRYALDSEGMLPIHLDPRRSTLALAPRELAEGPTLLVHGGGFSDLRPMFNTLLRLGRVGADPRTGEVLLEGFEPGPYRVCPPEGACREVVSGHRVAAELQTSQKKPSEDSP